MAPKTAAILLALAGFAMATPAPVVTLAPAASAVAVALGGANDPSATRVVNGPMAVAIAAPPQYLTIQVTNSCAWAISTSFVNAAAAPTPVSGNQGAGTLGVGAVGQIVVPTGWIGNIPVVQYGGGRVINGDDSLIEANFVVPSGYSVAVADVDISYVNGFSLAITCKCAGVIVTGCKTYLWNNNSCPNDDGVGACINPLRSSETATAATTFFAPCQGQAYTYVNDHAANSFGECQSGLIQCCVGSQCPS